MTVPVQELVDAALAASRSDGCVVVAREQSEANLRFANNGLTTNGEMTSQDMTVVSVVEAGGEPAAAGVTRTVTTVEEVRALVAASQAAAAQAAPAEDVAPLLGPVSDDGGYGRPAARTGIEVFDRFARDLGGVLDGWRARDQLLFGFAEHTVTSTFVATSAGLRRRHDQPSGRLELNGKAGPGASAWDGVHSRDFTDVDVAALTDRLRERLGWAGTRIDLPAGRYETILPPTALADLYIDAYWTASARDAEEGRSVFAGPDGSTRVGGQLATLPITLRSDPHAADVGCAPFEIATSSAGGTQSVFDNGLDLDPTTWIDGGRLAELVRNRGWAARTGAAPRPAIDNLIMDSGSDATLEDLVASTGRGLLLTSLWYIRVVDPQTLLLTGLTRDGVYLVEDGKVRGAVNNFRWNESPIDLLARITELGRTEHCLAREWSDYFQRTRFPAARVPDFNMSTVSPAS